MEKHFDRWGNPCGTDKQWRAVAYIEQWLSVKYTGDTYLELQAFLTENLEEAKEAERDWVCMIDCFATDFW